LYPFVYNFIFLMINFVNAAMAKPPRLPIPYDKINGNANNLGYNKKRYDERFKSENVLLI